MSKMTKAPKKGSAYASHKPREKELIDAGLKVAEHHQPYGLKGKELETKLIDEIDDAGFDVAEFCEAYGLKREELGRLTGFSLRALAEWAAGKLPSQPALRRLREIRRLLDALSGLVQAKSISPWLHKKNPAFDGMTPLQVIEVGEMDRLWAMVYTMAHGVPE